MIEIAPIINALLLALGSSTDNFSVGFALGTKEKNSPHVSFQFNLIISLANAIGAYVAGIVGFYTIEILSTNVEIMRQYAYLFAALAFYYLALCEILQNDQSDHNSLLQGEKKLRQVIDIAIPMSLNNFASGIAGGTVGISPSSSFAMAFLCSFLMMDIGFRISKRCEVSWIASKSRITSFLIFVFLGNIQILDYFGIDMW